MINIIIAPKVIMFLQSIIDRSAGLPNIDTIKNIVSDKTDFINAGFAGGGKIVS